MYAYQLKIWYVSLVAEALLFAVLLWRRRWQDFPWFVSWIAFDLAISVLKLTVKATDGPYRAIYQATAPSFLVLMTAAGIEAITRTRAMWIFILSLLTVAGGLLAFYVAPLPREWPQHILEPLFFARGFVGVVLTAALSASAVRRRPSHHALILGAVAGVNALAYLFPRPWPSCVFLTGETAAFLAWAYCMSRPVMVLSNQP